jgi:hypothetical protein
LTPNDLHGAEHGFEQDLADEHLGHGSDGVTLAVIRNRGIGWDYPLVGVR